jgi:hypothetical protein
MLEADEDHWIGIGGGDADGHYFVTITDDSTSTYYLAMTPDAPDTKIWLEGGGQPADYPARQCVDLATALRAAQTYCTDGSRDPDVVWEET